MVIVLLAVSATALGPAAPDPTATQQLQQHWVPGWGYRDELSPASIDYQHFWSDNAGKILTMAMLANDTTGAQDAARFLAANMGNGYYLPELLVNSTGPTWMSDASGYYITNGIVELHGDNSSDGLDQLEIGNNYTGYLPLAYLGGDRIWVNQGQGCCAVKAQSSSVFVIPDGFSKRSFFDVNGSEFYVYANATLSQGAPYASVSLQVEPLGSMGPSASYAFLQLFNTTTTYPFEDASHYESNGTFAGELKPRGAIPLTEGGLALAYSNRTSVFTTYQGGVVSGQDAVAVAFGNQSLYDLEHWTGDVPFSHSWLGVGYSVPTTAPGVKSAPVYAKVYPIEHFDFRLANETARYIATSPTDVSVAPPVGFGFDAYGLSLLAQNNSAHSSLAKGYWGNYFARYNGTNPATAYARSINTLALAGFDLYGCNSTVESFTRAFVGTFPGSSIEEYGWAVAALHQLYLCTGSPSDLSLYQAALGRLSPNPVHFVALDIPNSPNATWTFQYGEAASGLLLGGVRYNDSLVLGAMNAVYQSDVNGSVLNTPYGGEQANTETLPAYMLSTWLFEHGMSNATGYWVSSLSDCNITALAYGGGILTLSVEGGSDGRLVLNGPAGSQTFYPRGSETLKAGGSTTEFPYQYLAVSILTALVVGSYLCARRRNYDVSTRSSTTGRR